jgi:hypothetical protein
MSYFDETYNPDEIFADRFDCNLGRVLAHLEPNNTLDSIVDDSSSLSEGEEGVIMGVSNTPEEVDLFDLIMGENESENW